jgi:single-strand DNA-binding protein
MIKLQVIGNIGKSAELHTFDGGNTVANFSVAHTEKFTTAQGERKEKTTWVDVSVWGKLANSLAPYLTKGTKVFVEGTPEARGYNTSDGKAGASLKVNALTIELLSPKQEGEVATPAASSNGFAGQNDDLPF